MRIVVHDYAGHAFPLDLSRWLATQGHQVLHLYSQDVEAPRGPVSHTADMPRSFAIEGLSRGRPMPKYAPLRRWRWEKAYGRLLAKRVRAYAPDVILSTNTSPLVQAALERRLTGSGIRLICWVQDIFTPGVERFLQAWPTLVTRLVRARVAHLEFGVMRRSAGIIVISPDFQRVLATRGVDHPNTAVIENWFPTTLPMVGVRPTSWEREVGLEGRFIYLYAGTLGLKHDPSLLIALARGRAHEANDAIVVVANGPGMSMLEQAKRAEGLSNLHLFPLQPHERLPDVFGAADIMLVLLEPFAGMLSVPSKVYAAFAAGRPVLGAMPTDNLARRLVQDIGAGICVSPGDSQAFIEAATQLRMDSEMRNAQAKRSAAYAAATNDMAKIGPKFLSIIEKAIA
ncbi:glycosyltransferase family 4 protein [Rhodospirillum sp. A1_3_36]|uniref:glycosyltransferase family 4 protein n=1 Tax=Rhodospirillum sp. A1_3_36 TaxID=3391666 RepID=UPI0039A7495C